MLQRFLVLLFSSWVVNPLGILLAQAYGVANAPIVVLLLLAVGACVPFQLLLNECVAAAVNRESIKRPTRSQVSLILSLQVLACGAATMIFSGQQFALFSAVAVTALLAYNTLLSYRVAERFYALVHAGSISYRQTFAVGVIPGAVSLVLYFFFGLSSTADRSVDGFVMAVAIVPSIVQLGYVSRARRASSASLARPAAVRPPSEYAQIRTSILLGSALLLLALAVVSAKLREDVARLAPAYMALLLVAMNSLFSFINVATRASYLQQRKSNLKAIFVPLIFLMIAAAVIGAMTTKAPDFVVLLLMASQAVTALVIESTRQKMVALRSDNSPGDKEGQ